ncbi:protein SCO2 homolog, mitochondrial isoform X2 [Scyliorhinus torazame]|uniref:protein SCO2 homolog, mitochondrial isoform X2 n=1 Tax=Scyliorhinus torazame TaxID=75743 RepID=UPI003B59BAA7
MTLAINSRDADRFHVVLPVPGMLLSSGGYSSCWRLLAGGGLLKPLPACWSGVVSRHGGAALRSASCPSKGARWRFQSTSVITDCSQKMLDHLGTNQLYCSPSSGEGLITESLSIPASQITATRPNCPLESVQCIPQLTICKAPSQHTRKKPQFQTEGRLLRIRSLLSIYYLAPRIVHISPGSSTLVTHRPFSQSKSDRSSGRQVVSPKIRLRTKFMVICVCGAAVMGLWFYVHLEKEQQQKMRRQEQLKKLALGQGDFNLLDHTGRSRTKKDFSGQWVLLYFGFTHCPDICPDELDKISSVVQILDKERALSPVQPIFITVDPERDGVEEMARYIKDFHSRMVGLTGTAEQIKDLGKAFRVYYSVGPKDEDNDYIVDHTIIIYLLNPDGLFTDYYNRNKSDQEIAESIRSHMKTYVNLFN